jgi:hypothetical protein
MGNLIYVIGFQRSGNHWLCRTLSDLFSVPIDNGKGDIRFAHRIDPERDFKIKIVHWPRQKYLDRGHGRSFVYTMRDPRDMVTSLKYYGGHKTLRQAMDWLSENHYSAFIKGWMNNPPELGTSYEEMHRDREMYYRLSAIYLAIMQHECHPQHIVDVIQRQKFANWTHTNRRINRKGIIGDWRNHFCRKDGERFERDYGWIMEAFDYEKDRDWWKGLPNARR